MAMLDLQKLKSKYNMEVRGVVHVGAHLGQELADYERLKFGDVAFIEPIPEAYRRLVRQCKYRHGVKTFCTAISDYIGEAEFYVTNNEQSSSLLKLKEHSEIYPKIVETETIRVSVTTLDTLLSENGIRALYNFLVVDVQGAELSVFRGARGFLETVDYIIAEINRRELYEGCVLESGIDEFLGGYGFESREECFLHPSWGDKFYVKG